MSTIGVRELARHASSIINVLSHAPQFVDGMAAADIELAAGETVSLANARAELEADVPTNGESGPV